MMSLKSAFEVIQHVGREKTWTCIFAPAKLLNSAKVLVDGRYQTYIGERCRGNERYELPNSPWTHIILIGSDISEPAENEHKNDKTNNNNVMYLINGRLEEARGTCIMTNCSPKLQVFCAHAKEDVLQG